MNKLGRPTKYSRTILKKAIEYLELCKDTDGYAPGKMIVDLPSIGGLARHLGIRRETVWAWCKDEDKKQFSNIIEQLQAEQEKRLINNGLAGTYNPTIAKVLLAKQGYRDAVDTDITSKGEKLSSINVTFTDFNGAGNE